LAPRRIDPLHQVLAQHVQGQRLDHVTHMCPECGGFPRPLCQTCLGSGVCTEEMLARWQTRILAEGDV
jgi:hypothetical protein